MKILYFAWLREKVGVPEEEWTLPQDVRTVAELVDWLKRQSPRHDIAFLASALSVAALAILGRVAGVARFDAYPQVHAPVSGGTVVLCVALAVAVLAPFADRRGIDR